MLFPKEVGGMPQQSNQKFNEVFIARSDNNIQLVNSFIFTTGPVARKPVLWVSDITSLKLFDSATETS